MELQETVLTTASAGEGSQRVCSPPIQHVTRDSWMESLKLACTWLISRAMVAHEQIDPSENPHAYPYRNWRGAMREYNARTRRWHVFGPLWHTGQAIKAIVAAHRVIGDRRLLEAARLAGDFLLDAQISDRSDPDFGLIVAYENQDPNVSATSCMLEALSGLIALGDATGEARYADAVLHAARWALKRVFLPKEGLFLDDFLIQQRKSRVAPETASYGVPGRPLNDDAVMLWAARTSGEPGFAEAFFTVAERLLRDEDPSGNWIKYPPCKPAEGMIHPRHAFWWGRPMVAAWRDSGDSRFLECALRCAQWYGGAVRRDGGLFRHTYRDFTTRSFGHASSGAFCATLLWQDLMLSGQAPQYHELIERVLAFGRDSQFTSAVDPQLHGAILEKILPPDGTDRPPYLIRDLATIFYVQALAHALEHNLLTFG